MTKCLWAISLCLIITCSLALAQEAVVEPQKEEPPKVITWMPTFEAALEAAVEQNKPVFVDFYSKYCSYCAKMDRETLTKQVVKDIGSEFIAVKIDVDKREDLAEQYQVYRYPLYFVLDAEGNELFQEYGYLPAEPFAVRLKLGLAIWQAMPELKELQEKQAAAEITPQELARLGFLLRQAGKMEDAQKALDAAIKELAADAPERNEANLDKILINLAAEKVDALRQVGTWLVNNPEHERRFEARYEKGMANANFGELQTAVNELNRVYFDAAETDWGIMAHYYSGIISAELARPVRTG